MDPADESFVNMDYEDLDLLEQLYPELTEKLSTAKKNKNKYRKSLKESKCRVKLNFSDCEDSSANDVHKQTCPTEVANECDGLLFSDDEFISQEVDKDGPRSAAKRTDRIEMEEEGGVDESNVSLIHPSTGDSFISEDDDVSAESYDGNSSSMMEGSPAGQRVQPSRSAKSSGMCSARSLAPPRVHIPGMYTPSRAHELVKIEESEDDEESFEKYLKSLRKEKEDDENEEEGEEEGMGEDSFVVSDDDEDVINDSYEEGCSEWEEDEEDSGSSCHSDDSIVDKPPPPNKQILTDRTNNFRDLAESFRSPSVKYTSRNKVTAVDEHTHFLRSLSADYEGHRHVEAEAFIKRGVKGDKQKTLLIQKLFALFNKEIFNEKLPSDLSIKFNPRLRLTAGYCKYSKRSGAASIEISPKVCSTPDRVRDTLAHEMCHAAVFLVDKMLKERHGPVWKQWAFRFPRRFNGFPVPTRCHAYEVEAKFVYECTSCGQLIKRHSKSLDTVKKCCGICRGKLILRDDGMEKRKVTPFAAFVKDNYGKEKKDGRSHKEIMQCLSAKFKLRKEEDGRTMTKEVALDLSTMSIQEENE